MTAAPGIDCRELVALVTDYLEHALDPETERLFEAHLRICAPCEVYLAQLRSTIAQLGHLPTTSLSDDAVDTLTRAFRDLLP